MSTLFLACHQRRLLSKTAVAWIHSIVIAALIDGVELAKLSPTDQLKAPILVVATSAIATICQIHIAGRSMSTTVVVSIANWRNGTI
jgi:hypothetical protein